MFKVINEEREIGKILKDLSKDSITGIFDAGPTIGILVLETYFKPGGNTPVPSVVSSKLIKTNFYHWRDFRDHLDWYFENIDLDQETIDIKKIKKYICEISKKEKLLFCYSIALFIESQMRIFSQSPHPVQDVVRELISPIFRDEKIFDDYSKPESVNDINAKIYVTLHHGMRPLVQVNFPVPTIRQWQNELEAGIALIIPQLVNFSIKNLESPEKYLLKEIIHNEFLTWEIDEPVIGEKRKWSWLPQYPIDDSSDFFDRQAQKVEINSKDLISNSTEKQQVIPEIDNNKEEHIRSYTMNPNIAKEFSMYLKKDEELINVERLQTRTPVLARAVTMGYSNLANQYHYIGLTNQRVIIIPLNRMTGKPKEDQIFSCKYNDVEIKSDKLFVAPPGKEKTKKYFFMSGIKSLTKLDKEQFLFQLQEKQREE